MVPLQRGRYPVLLAEVERQVRRRSKAYKDYTEAEHMRMINEIKFTVFFEEGDWSVKTYPSNDIINITHKHKNGTTYVIPFKHCVTKARVHDKQMCNYGCHVCHDKAPESIVVVWKLLSWENWENR